MAPQSILVPDLMNSLFEFVPFEEELYLRQEEYYDSLAQCHVNGNANVFIDFMLQSIKSILDKVTPKTILK